MGVTKKEPAGRNGQGRNGQGRNGQGRNGQAGQTGQEKRIKSSRKSDEAVIMNKSNLIGPPYFGWDTSKIINQLQQNEISSSNTLRQYNSLYELVTEETSKEKDTLVIITNNGQKYPTYLRDIIFNYRDRAAYIPYFTWQTKDILNEGLSDNHGHLLRTAPNTISLRYNYKLNIQKITLPLTLELLNPRKENLELRTVSTSTYSKGVTFSLEELYSKYRLSAYDNDSELSDTHIQGYHWITKSVSRPRNIEKILRKENNLANWLKEPDYRILQYRDVRNGKAPEPPVNGTRDSVEQLNYWQKRLRFESYVYCNLRDNKIPTDISQSEWAELGKTVSSIKYGAPELPLIIKGYWLNTYNTKLYPQYTWDQRRSVIKEWSDTDG